MGYELSEDKRYRDFQTTFRKEGLKVLKFGGTSVGTVDGINRVVRIIRDTAKTHRAVVVLSAAAGVTDQLIVWLDNKEGVRDKLDSMIDELAKRHREMASELLTPALYKTFDTLLTIRLATLKKLLISLSRGKLTPHIRDEVMATGERLSAPLVALALRDLDLPAYDYDAGIFIKTDDTHGDARVDLERTKSMIRNWYHRTQSSILPIVTGFIGATSNGRTTTLGRGGSDYTAAILAAALEADAMERWTDVDGIYTDDPRKNKNAKKLARIVLDEAVAWNRAGRLGMHRKALDPLVAARVPVYIRNTAHSDAPGTVILPVD